MTTGDRCGGQVSRRLVSRRRALGAALAWPLACTLLGFSRQTAAQALDDGPTGTLAVPRGSDLVLIEADGGGERVLLTLAAGAFVSDAAWSPDGRRIACTRYMGQPGQGPARSALLVVGLEPGDGPPVVLVPPDPAGMMLAEPAWAPDGSGLAFQSIGLPAGRPPVLRIEWVAADDSGRRTLVEDGRGPTFSPDGTTIAYVKLGSRGEELWVRSTAGGAGRQVIADEGLMALTTPRFSPNGGQIAFAGVGDVGGSGMRPDSIKGALDGEPGAYRSLAAGPRLHGPPWDPFLVDLSGADLRRLTLLGEDEAAVAWSPDGRWIAVSGVGGLSVPGASVRTLSIVATYGGIDWR